jgi:hypothetical protein
MMLQTENSILIRRRIEDVYQFVATDFFENYPRWSPQVRELEKLSSGPMRVGVVGRQVRSDGGYRSEARFQVTHFTPLLELRFASTTKPHFHVHYRFEPVASDTRLTFNFNLELPFLIQPLHHRVAEVVKRGGSRVLVNLKTLLETAPALDGDELGGVPRQAGRTAHKTGSG